jgi:hypothetical protein
MHRFQSQSTITRFRLASFLLCLKLLLIPGILGLLAYSIVESDHKLTYIALGAAGGTLMLAVLQFLLAGRARCPLCMTPVLASKGCSKHRNARTFFGSYRLRVALAVLFKGSFKCPYCNEPSVMEIRVRHGQARGR